MRTYAIMLVASALLCACAAPQKPSNAKTFESIVNIHTLADDIADKSSIDLVQENNITCEKGFVPGRFEMKQSDSDLGFFVFDNCTGAIRMVADPGRLFDKLNASFTNYVEARIK